MRSLRNRLSALFALIVVGAMAFVYVDVIPPLQSSLRQGKLAGLARDAALHSRPLMSAFGSDVPQKRVDRLVRDAADRASARVTLLGVARGPEGRRAYVVSDSAGRVDVDDIRFPAAEESVRTGRPATATEPTRTGRIGEAAQPLFVAGRVAGVVVVSDSLADVQENVAVVRRRLLAAGGIALLVAILAGYVVARVLSARVKKLERAARKVAAGDFSETIRVESEDELGDLAAAFNDMQRQLAQLDSARKRFIATASHELRTPIFSLSGFLELLEDEDLDDDTRRAFVGQLRGQVERLHKLATELLDLSRLEAGSLDLRLEAVDIGQLVREVVAEFGPALARHGSALELQLEGEPLDAVGDAERVVQVLRILLDNALVHTPTGTPIVMTARRQNGAVRVEVRDRGPGIDRRAAERVFEPFFTADGAQGAGLGLAIARELAERMRGRLLLADPRPAQTTFALELPA